MKSQKKSSGVLPLKEKIHSLLEQKVSDLSSRLNEELTTKDVDVLLKLANLRDRLGGRPMLAASIAVIEELLIFLDGRDRELKGRLEEHLAEFFAKMRADYE
ncbi:MAG: hypothetical protein HZA78_10660 [Candidatus Schekmanbacteria bacterium]|nr:hypothetical protein [Candidatus Schekmanbacteria bacterium]